MARRRRKGGLFKPPRHKWLADIITFKSPSAARKAASKLTSALKRRRLGRKKIGKKTALIIERALNYAANRAKASARRKALSAKERKELKEISEIYRRATERAKKIYASKY